MLPSSVVLAVAALLAGGPRPVRSQVPFATLHPVAAAHVGKTADWVLATSDAVWVGSTGPFAVHRIDPRSNRVVATVDLPGEPCAGLAVASGSLWAPLCGKVNTLARIDLKTNRLREVLPVGPAAAEGGIAASGQSLWVVTNAKGVLTEIDAMTGRVRRAIAVPAGSYNPVYSAGVVWITGHDTGVVTAIDANSGRTLASVVVGEGPRFLTVGAGSVWVLLQGTGEVVRIDATKRRVVARIAAGLAGHGGDITFGAGQVWPTLSGIPLTRIDARTNRIERQWKGPGGDSLAWAFDAIWLSDYKAGTIARYPAAVLGAR